MRGRQVFHWLEMEKRRECDFHTIKAKQQTKAYAEIMEAAVWAVCVMGQILPVTSWQVQGVCEDLLLPETELARSLACNFDCIYES